LVPVKALPELLPGNFLARLFEITCNLAFVVRIRVSFQMSAFGFDNNDAGYWLFFFPILEDEVGINAVYAKALNREVFFANFVLIPP